jgi:lysophospholipase L1-like esterase
MSRTKFLAVGVVVLASLMAVSFFVVLFYENNSSWNKIPKATLVACVGDSITQDSGYPEILQEKLGHEYIVENFGVGSTTVLANSNRPYRDQSAFLNAKLSSPSFVIIMLGTNDAKPINFVNVQNFVLDYEELIGEFQDLPSKPRILILIPPPVFNNQVEINETNLEQNIIPRIQQVASTLNLPTINIYSLLINHPDYFPDGVHPSIEGARLVADKVEEFILASDR